MPLRNSKFISGLPELVHERFDKDLNAYSIIDLMISILKHTNEKAPVLKNTIPLFNDENNNESLIDALIINNSENKITVMTSVQLISLDHHKLKVN